MIRSALVLALAWLPLQSLQAADTSLQGLVEHAPSTTGLQIPKIARAPKLEEFAAMKPAPEWEGRLAVVNGAAQKSQSATTDGSDQIVVDIPGACPTVCGKSLDVDMSLSGDNGEDTPFLNVPISCVTASPTTTIQSGRSFRQTGSKACMILAV